MDDNVNVEFHFKDDPKKYRANMTKKQFENMKKLPIIDYCKIIPTLGKSMPEEKEKQLRKKLENALQNDTSHIHKLSYD